ncbi:MAG: hypothetical protein DRI34_01950 [Deltaproteobacteria bacterium]|nr:MAG: hypothetical protein DRI34_01950 [Deltaproteobacteria bacterium]
MKRLRGEHLLFGLTLVALAALASWWAVFFLRSVESEEKAEKSGLLHAVVVTALMLGHEQQDPPLGPLAGPAPLEVVPAPPPQAEGLVARIVPNHPRLAVRARPRAVAAIEQRVARRRAMLVGEGAFMLLLIVVLSFMLYRLVQQERRHLRHVESFVAAVTHEMKTPLAGIKSLLQTMAAGRVPEERKQELLALGLKESERLEHTIENVLLAGKLRGGRLETRPEPLELAPFLDAFLRHRRRYLLQQPDSLQLAWKMAGTGTRVEADAQALRTILENLVDNAFKYGGEQPRVEIIVAAEDGEVSITVADNGIGFTPGQAQAMFSPFHRAVDPRSREAVKHGTGLGLSLSLQLARLMKGRLIAESDGPGRGSRFTLVLPEAERQS